MPPDPAATADPARIVPPRRQNRTTRRSVLIADRAADWTITVGGLLVIVAVFGIMVFLAQVTVPLFAGAALESQRDYPMGTGGGRTLMVNLDENRTIAFAIQADGAVKVVSPFRGSPADKAGVKAGDYITHLDGKLYYGGDIYEAGAKMRGGGGPSIRPAVFRPRRPALPPAHGPPLPTLPPGPLPRPETPAERHAAWLIGKELP